ncbi:MAG: hypothetical protein ACOC0Z_07960 [Halohasta sp.]
MFASLLLVGTALVVVRERATTLLDVGCHAAGPGWRPSIRSASD